MAVLNEFLESVLWVEHRTGVMPEELVGVEKCYVKLYDDQIICAEQPERLTWSEVKAYAYARRTPCPDADGWIPHNLTKAVPAGVTAEYIEVRSAIDRAPYLVPAADVIWTVVSAWRNVPQESIALAPAPYQPMSSPGYESLANVFCRAYDQASSGKGDERHATPVPFERQGMLRRIEAFGVGFALGQADKKAEESLRLPHERAVTELLGAMVYLAGAVIHLESKAAQ